MRPNDSKRNRGTLRSDEQSRDIIAVVCHLAGYAFCYEGVVKYFSSRNIRLQPPLHGHFRILSACTKTSRTKDMWIAIERKMKPFAKPITVFSQAFRHLTCAFAPSLPFMGLCYIGFHRSPGWVCSNIIVQQSGPKVLGSLQSRDALGTVDDTNPA